MPEVKEPAAPTEGEQAEQQASNYPPCYADDELKNNIRAKCHLLYVVTWEEKRVIDSLNAICDDEKINYQGVQVWDSARGLRIADRPGKPGAPVEGGHEMLTPDDILDHIHKKAEEMKNKKVQLKQSKGPIFVLCDMFRYLSPNGLEPQVERKIRALATMLKRTTIHVVITSPELQLPTALEKCVMVLDYPLPEKPQLNVMVEKARTKLLERKRVKEEDLKETPNEVVVRALQGLTMQEAEDALAKAVVVTDKFDIKTLLELKRQIIRKGQLLDYIQPTVGMNDVGGLKGVKEFIDYRKRAFSDAAVEYGLPAPRGVFMLGVQGSGKSLSAKAIATSLGCPLLKMDMGRMFGSLMGESESNIKRALHIAESVAPCVLLVDEIDKALSGASGVTTDSGTTKRVIGTLLDWMQEKTKPVFLVACANSIAGLAAETLRKGRFDEMFFVDLPDVETRAEIFRIHIRKRKRDPDNKKMFNIAEMADDKNSEHFSGAEIEAAIVDSMYAAFGNGGREFNTKDIVRSLTATEPLAKVMKDQIDALRDDAGNRGMKRADAPYYADEETAKGSEESRFSAV